MVVALMSVWCRTLDEREGCGVAVLRGMSGVDDEGRALLSGVALSARTVVAKDSPRYVVRPSDRLLSFRGLGIESE